MPSVRSLDLRDPRVRSWSRVFACRPFVMIMRRLLACSLNGDRERAEWYRGDTAVGSKSVDTGYMGLIEVELDTIQDPCHSFLHSSPWQKAVRSRASNFLKKLFERLFLSPHLHFLNFTTKYTHIYTTVMSNYKVCISSQPACCPSFLSDASVSRSPISRSPHGVARTSSSPRTRCQVNTRTQQSSVQYQHT